MNHELVSAPWQRLEVQAAVGAVDAPRSEPRRRWQVGAKLVDSSSVVRERLHGHDMLQMVKRFGFERDGLFPRPPLDRGRGSGAELLPDPLFVAIERRIEAGRELFEQRLYQRAWQEFGAACSSLPEPATAWNLAGWLFAALGECAWQLGDFELAKKFLSTALSAPGTVGNAVLHLRYGQALYEVGDPRARMELQQALSVGGVRVFALEDAVYQALAVGGDVTELIPRVPEQLFEQIAFGLDHAKALRDDAVEVAAAIVDLRRRELASSALAGARIGLVLGSSPRAQEPGTLEAVEGDTLEVRIDSVIHPRGRIVLCQGIVREGSLRIGARLRWRRATHFFQPAV